MPLPVTLSAEPGVEPVGNRVDNGRRLRADEQRPQRLQPNLYRYKLPAAQAFARVNGLDRVVLDGPRRRLGIVTTGKAYLDVRQALEELGIDEARAEAPKTIRKRAKIRRRKQRWIKARRPQRLTTRKPFTTNYAVCAKR